jgi:hypothetical protein
MKLFWFVLITGFVLFFFIVQAFKLDIFSLEMLTHNLYHFLIAFVILGYFFLHMTLKIMKFLLILVLCLLVLDEIVHYVSGVGNISAEVLIMNFYLLVWGGLSGFLFTRFWTAK